jgi:hypothetical protein
VALSEVSCTNQPVLPLELLSLKVDADVVLSPFLADIIAPVPDPNLPRAVLAVGDGSFEAAKRKVVILDLDREPPDARAVRQALGDSPTLIDAGLFEPEVEVMCTGMMLLYYEPRNHRLAFSANAVRWNRLLSTSGAV